MGPADREFRDVVLIDFRENRSSLPVMLTSNGGGSAHEPVWSSDGMYLAFSDFDENGIVQILVYGVEEERLFQLTNFGDEMRGWRIVELVWSHDDVKVAFSADKNRGEQSPEPVMGVLGVSSRPQGALLWISPPIERGYTNLSWELDDLHLMAVRYLPGQKALVLLDGETGEVKEVLGPLLNEKDKSERKEMIRKFTMPILIGYIYETEDGIIYPDPSDVLLLIKNLVLPPQGPIDLNKCPAESLR
jgi:dipeptidyl aminopeptidase/acylaminoacyl peptidase